MNEETHQQEGDDVEETQRDEDVPMDREILKSSKEKKQLQNYLGPHSTGIYSWLLLLSSNDGAMFELTSTVN